MNDREKEEQIRKKGLRVEWFAARKNRNKKNYFVAIHETPAGISMAYTIPGLFTNDLPVVKLQSFVPAITREKKQLALLHFIQENHLENSCCSYIVSMDSYHLILLEAPPVTKEEFSKAAVWLLKDMVNFPPEDAVIDTFELPVHRARDNVKMIYAAVVQKVLVERIKAFIQPTSLKLTYIDIPELALRNIEKYYKKDENGVVLLQIYPSGGKLIFCKEGKLLLTRSIDLKLENLGNEEANDAKLLDFLSLEIQRSFDYLSSVFRQSVGNGMVIVPALVNTHLIQSYLTSTLGIEVDNVNLSQYITFEKTVSNDEQAKNLLAIGGVLRDVTEIAL